MRVRIKDIRASFIMIITLIAFFLIAFITSIGGVGVILAFLLFIIICGLFVYILTNSIEISTVLATPILLSVFQNVYLGMFSPHLSGTVIQILTVLNFLLSCLIFIFLLRRNPTKGNGGVFTLLITLVFYTMFSVLLLNHINILSIISSFRNIISVFLFFLIGVFALRKMELRKFENIIICFGLIVIAMGIYDVLIGGTLWRKLNITDLWTKKGIALQPSGLPTNFYSSETINGERIRRMTSTFADPVNLGSFLFAVFGIAWHRNKRIIEILMIIGMILTISKGAWLGLLIFMCVYAYYYLPRPIFFSIMALSGVLGIAFLVYAFKTSANSVFLHISGLFASFEGLIRKPLGSGIGSNGVLAKQFSGFSSNADVTETGLGMIVSQLGIIGLLIYIIFFKNIVRWCLSIPDKKDAVLTLSLSISVIANIFFNEVALSPNTCATYFLIIGFVIAKYHFNGSHNINEE